MSRLKDTLDLVRKKKMVMEGKQIELEENDYKALLIAAFSVFGPVLLGCIAFFGVLIWLLTLAF